MVFEIIKSVVRPVENLRHVAYLLPHTDVTAEMDCARMLPGNVIHVQRMWLDDVGEEAERRMVAEELPAALRYLKGVAPYGCAVFGCTSASAANGREGMLAIERQMRRELSCPSITALGAVLKEIDRRGARSVEVLTPYTEAVNVFFRETLERFGVKVSFIAGMGLSCDNDIAALDPADICGWARSQRECVPKEADLCFFSCTNLRAAEVQKELEGCVGRPVITSNQCVIDYIKALP